MFSIEKDFFFSYIQYSYANNNLFGYFMKKETLYIRNYYYALLLSLSIIIVGSLAWNINKQYKAAINYAVIEGDASFNKDLLYRRWAALHGRVYVPISEHAMPNPYLNIKDRDVETTSGLRLTLMNPVDITRQAFTMEKLQSGVNSHITSLNSLHPDDKADEWELKALKQLASGISSVSEIVTVEEKDYLRFMSPLKAEGVDMKFHDGQRYSIGDQVGGISVSVPLNKYYKVANKKVKALLISHTSVYLMLIFFTTWMHKRIVSETNNNELMRKKLKLSEVRLMIRNKESEKANSNLKIVNEQLRVAKKRAEESDELKTAFLQNISHEVRTPLNAILGFASMLGMPDLDQESKKNYLSIIQSNSDQLLSIVTDVLAMSSLETKQVQTIIEKVNVNKLLEMMYDLFDSRSKQKKLEFNVNLPLPEDNAYVYTDKTKITQVITNLLSNAFKYTPQGAIEFGYRKQVNKYLFYVSDTGIGIPTEMYDKVFERFVQVDNSETSGGSGLGLAISKGFVELLEGELWFESELRGGTTFYFTIPHKPKMQ